MNYSVFYENLIKSNSKIAKCIDIVKKQRHTHFVRFSETSLAFNDTVRQKGVMLN